MKHRKRFLIAGMIFVMIIGLLGVAAALSMSPGERVWGPGSSRIPSNGHYYSKDSLIFFGALFAVLGGFGLRDAWRDKL